METLPAYLALHGAIVLTIGFVAGLLLHRAIRLNVENARGAAGENAAAWHLAHAGISGRGVLLMALAGIFHWITLPDVQRHVVSWLMLFFVWTSTAAMMVAAMTGERGLTWHGSLVNRVVFALYVVGAIAVFPSAFLIIAGLARAL